MLESMLQRVPGFAVQWDFHLETPRSERTYEGLKNRLQELVDRDARNSQRQQQEAHFTKQLGGSSGSGNRNTQTNKVIAGVQPDKAPKNASNADPKSQSRIEKLKAQL